VKSTHLNRTSHSGGEIFRSLIRCEEKEPVRLKDTPLRRVIAVERHEQHGIVRWTHGAVYFGLLE
jgi:hypothetical protein